MGIIELNRNDFLMSHFGDMCVDRYGDIHDTFTFEEEHGVLGISLKQEIITRMESYSNDWYLYPEIAMNIRDLVGTEADIRWVINTATNMITKLLTMDGLLLVGQFNIYPLITSPTSVHFVIKVKLPDGSLDISFTYDYENNKFRNIL